MNVSLTPELEKFVESKVQSGRYQSASEVIREGLRLLDDQDRLRAAQIEEVRRKVQVGIEQHEPLVFGGRDANGHRRALTAVHHAFDQSDRGEPSDDIGGAIGRAVVHDNNLA